MSSERSDLIQMYRALESLYQQEQWHVVDSILSAVIRGPMEDIPTTQLVGLLRSTYAVRARITFYDALLVSACAELGRRGENLDTLLAGLHMVVL